MFKLRKISLIEKNAFPTPLSYSIKLFLNSLLRKVEKNVNWKVVPHKNANVFLKTKCFRQKLNAKNKKIPKQTSLCVFH